MKKTNAFALIPIGVFVVFYLSLGIIFEYVMKISMGFYNVPVVVAFLVALLVAIIQRPFRLTSLKSGHWVFRELIITLKIMI